MPYLTGDTLPASSKCRTIRIPDVDWCVECVNGALLELAEVYNWETIGAVTAQQAADRFWLVWEEYQRSVCTPIGSIIPFGGADAPEHFLMCDGASYPTADYPALFGVIGYSFGGAGANFSVPDLRSRAPIGAGQGAGLSSYAVGDTVGEETHLLDVSEMPSHSHFAEPHAHGYNSAISVAPVLAPGEAPVAEPLPFLTDLSGVTIDPTGGSGAHENRQPSIALNFIIAAT